MADTGAIRAGRAFVEIGGDRSKLDKVLKNIQADMRAFGAGITALGKRAFLFSSAAAVGLGGALLGVAAKFAQAGSEINDMAARTGMGTNALSELGFAAEQSGASLGDVETAVKKMQKAIMAAKDGPLAALRGMSPEQQFDAIAESINGIEDPTAKAAKALEIFGKEGTALLPMLGDMKELRAEAVRLGLSMSGQQAAAADALGDSWDSLKGSLKGLSATIGGTVAPMLTTLTQMMTDGIVKAREWFEKNKASMGGLVEAVQSGDLAIAWKVVLGNITEQWINLKQIADEVITGISIGMINAAAGIQNAWITALTAMKNAWTEWESSLLSSPVYQSIMSKALAGAAGMASAANPVGTQQSADLIADTMGRQAAQGPGAIAANNAALEAQRRAIEAERQQRIGILGSDLASRGAGRKAEMDQANKDLAAAIAEAKAAAAKGTAKTAAVNLSGIDLEAAGIKSSVRGTFSASAVAGLGTESLQTRIAKATEKSAKIDADVLAWFKSQGFQVGLQAAP